MERCRKLVDRLLEGTLAIIMAVLTIDVLWQVVSRYALASPSSWTEELARFLLIWVSLLGAAYLTGQKGHIAIDLLPRSLTGSALRRLQSAINVVVFLFGLTVLGVGGTNLVYVTLSLGQSSPALNLPVGFVYMVLPLSGALMMFYSITDILSKPLEE